MERKDGPNKGASTMVLDYGAGANRPASPGAGPVTGGVGPHSGHGGYIPPPGPVTGGMGPHSAQGYPPQQVRPVTGGNPADALAATSYAVHAPPEPPSILGQLLAGKYKVNRMIGEGGMGAVYEGEHTEIGKRVAIKLVHAAHGKHAEIAERFKREARAASVVESEHIVQVFDVGYDPTHGLFMVMEFLRGRDLGSIIEGGGGPLDPLVACAVVAQAASGLEAAHQAGIVHRDLKPANIFLVSRSDGTTLVKLVDFGIAKVVRDAETAGGAGLTRIGSAIGTPQYMSPEQAQGLPTVDRRTDIYSLGAVLYEAITGKPAFAALNTYEQMIIQLITTTPPRLSQSVAGVSPELDQLVVDMMNKQADKRPQTMGAVLERLFMIYPEVADMRVAVPGMEGEGRMSRVGSLPGSRGTLGSIGGRASGRSATTGGTRSAVAYDAGQGAPDTAVLPKRGGPGKVIAIAVIAVAALGAGGVAVLKLRGGSAATAMTGTAVVASAPPAASVAPPVATPIPTVPPVAPVVAPVPPTPSVSVAPVVSVAPPVAPPSTGKGKAVAGRPPPPAKDPDKPAPPTGGGKVGSAGVSEQF
jgi:eukaryotic-like serine/threonine-protein kinase